MYAKQDKPSQFIYKVLGVALKLLVLASSSNALHYKELNTLLII
jgi:hypothetical protein